MLKKQSRLALVGGILAACGVASHAMAQAPDVRLCQLYGLTMNLSGDDRAGDTVAFAAATTSWNIGNAQLLWHQSPDWDHPAIVLNLYSLKDGRFRQIGQSWVKHGFFALSNTQCGGSCASTNGTVLGIGCTDTYSVSNNSSHGSLAPRSEWNPWTGQWNYQSSVLQVGGVPVTGIARRMQVKDADIDPALNAGAQLILEGYYVCKDDINAMNNAAWRPAAVSSGTSGGTYTMASMSSTAPVNVGYALDAWTGARQTIVAQEIPVVEFVSPDGRCILGSKVTDNGNGTWRYEYAVLNVDMDRQVGSFAIPLPSGVVVTNAGSWACAHHNEPHAWSTVTGHSGPPQGTGGTRNYGKAIDNNNWPTTITPGVEVKWGTPAVGDAAASNPIRWGTIRNFWFDATTAPEDGLSTFGLFKTGTPNALFGLTDIPSPASPPPFCLGDANGSGQVDFDDITSVLGNWGANYLPGSAGAGDANDDGVVNFDDITAVLSAFGNRCD